MERRSLEEIEVVVLCGGRGTRLGSLTAKIPKPLLPVGGSPFLLRRLLQLKQEGFTRVILAVHYLPEQFHAFVLKHADLLGDVVVIEEPTPLGTGGALRHAAQRVHSPVFAALNGDSWVVQSLAPVVAEHAQGDYTLTMVVVRAERVEGGARRKGLVSIGPRREILGLCAGDAASERWVNAGVYLLDKDRVLQWPSGPYDLEARFSSLVPSGQGHAFCSEGSLLDIGTPDCYAQANRMLKSSEMSRGRFLTTAGAREAT